MRRVAATVLAVALAGCGGGSEEVAAPAASTASSLGAPPVATTTSAAETEVEATPAGVLAALQEAGLPVTLVVQYDESTDPNKLLGRPAGYEAKSAFADSRLKPDPSLDKDAIERGGSIEIFTTAEGATKRKEFIAAIGAPLANEYDYTNGRVLVRVTGDLPPSQAKEYETALAAMKFR